MEFMESVCQEKAFDYVNDNIKYSIGIMRNKK